MTLEHRTVSEIASSSLAAARVLESHGIDSRGGGSQQLAEVCRERNVQIESLVLELEEASREITDWTHAPLSDLIHHLTAVDHTYFRSELSRLAGQLDEIASVGCDTETVVNQLPKIFGALRRELETHLDHEEKELFPVIVRSEAAIAAGEPLPRSPFAAFGGPVHVTEREHESASAALRLLRLLCDGYRPGSGSKLYREFVDSLRRLEVRIYTHMHLENNVLVPRAAAMRRQRRV
jgi:regulator of cell morphogenesis and NO signaling